MARKRMEEKFMFQSWDEVDSALKEIAENEMELEHITTDMNQKNPRHQRRSGIVK